MTTISKLAYQIVADTSGFTKGVTLTRNELALTKQVMRESISPTQAYAAEIQALDQVLAKGALSQEQYAAAVGKVKKEFYGELGGKIRNTGLAIAGTAGTITAGLGLMGKSFLDAYAGAEEAQAKLSAAMRAAGRDSADTMAHYKAFAVQIQQVTKVDDDAALGLLQVAESLGVTGGAAERAVRNAIGLQAALGMDAESAMKATAALEQGSTTMVTRYLPALKNIEDPAKRAAMAQELIGRMFAVAEGETQTYAGASIQLANAMGDLKEELGGVLAEALTPLIRTAKGVVESFSGMSDGTKTFVTYAGLGTAALGAFVTAGGTAVAICGQMVIWYGALQTSAVSAKVAQLALNSAIGLGYVAAAAAAVGAGYALGASLQSLTETAQVNSRVIGELRDQLQSISTLDVTGVAREDLEQYIASTEKQIQKIQQHNEELKGSQEWWNFWQSNKDLVQQNEAQIAALQDALAKAKTELVQGAAEATPAVGAVTDQMRNLAAATAAAGGEVVNVFDQPFALPPIPDPFGEVLTSADAAIANSVDLLPGWDDFAAGQADLGKTIDDTTKRLQEQIATAGLSAEQAELWRLAQAGATPEQLAQVDALQQQAAAAKAANAETARSVSEQRNLAAATRGSSEALDRIEAYRLMQAGDKTRPRPATPANWVGPPVVTEGPPPRSPRGPAAETGPDAGESPDALLAQAVELLKRIAAASEGEKIVVEQTA